jgi:DNA polymerase-3 subunit alpha
MIIAKEEITNYCPLAKGAREVVTTQYHDDPVLKLGLLKVDFLGLRTLTIINEAEKIIRAGAKPDFSWETISLEDPKTFQLLAQARTLGVFQLESRGMRDLLHKLKPTTIDDIIAVNALYRPGPMGSGMIDDFISRKHGATKVKYDHPILEPILKDTYGVILYQEQVMRIARDMAGFSMGQADGLRKAMGKKIPEELEKQRGNFIDGAKKNNIERKLAEKVFDNIVHFGGYGFNKSHAAAYGVVAYRTAYLKANYPMAFMTALLNSEIGRSAVANEDDNKLVGYLQDAEAMKIKILPPDIQTSPSRFTPENGNIRFGLMAVKNVGEGAVDSIVRERSTKGPFKNWNDFISRIDLHAANRKVLESLIKAGAFDSFGKEMHLTRAELTAQLDKSLEVASAGKHDELAGQGQLFDAGEFLKDTALPLKVEPWTDHMALTNEKEVLGYYLSGHPLAQHTQDIVSFAQYRLDRLPPGSQDFRNAPMVRLAGMLVNPKRMVSKEKKEQYARFKLEDMHGEIEAVVFPRGYPGLAKYITPNNFVVVKGKLSARDSSTELIVEDIKPLSEAKQIFKPYLREVHIKVSSVGLEDGLLDQLKGMIGKFPGASPVLLDVLTPPSGEYVVETGLKIAAEQNFFNELEKMLGPESWELQSTSA